MSLTVYSFSIIGIQVEYGDFNIAKDMGILCLMGHKQNAKEKFCPECGGKFAPFSKDVANKALLKLCEFVGIKVEKGEDGDEDDNPWSQLLDNCDDNDIGIHTISSPSTEIIVLGKKILSVGQYRATAVAISFEDLMKQHKEMQEIQKLLDFKDRPIELFNSLYMNS